MTIRNDKLPHKEGFFFDESRNDAVERAETVAILQNAIASLESPDERAGRCITYRAIW